MGIWYMVLCYIIFSSSYILLGGEQLGERYIWWNFVSSRKDRIEEAKAGRILLPPSDNIQFVPLPDDHTKSAGGPSPQALS
jgi:hypothetical protein